MARYHKDEETRVLGERHAGIVIKDGKLLTVHRIKEGREYWVFPGGHRREDETGEQAVMREVYEEAGIEVTEPKLVFEFKNYLMDHVDYYYLCDWKYGVQPHLTGEEKDADPKIDFFDPVWVDLTGIEQLNILPKFAKEWLMEYLKEKNFTFLENQ